jgi:hypothetical protein
VAVFFIAEAYWLWLARGAFGAKVWRSERHAPTVAVISEDMTAFYLSRQNLQGL